MDNQEKLEQIESLLKEKATTFSGLNMTSYTKQALDELFHTYYKDPQKRAQMEKQYIPIQYGDKTLYISKVYEETNFISNSLHHNLDQFHARGVKLDYLTQKEVALLKNTFGDMVKVTEHDEKFTDDPHAPRSCTAYLLTHIEEKSKLNKVLENSALTVQRIGDTAGCAMLGGGLPFLVVFDYGRIAFFGSLAGMAVGDTVGLMPLVYHHFEDKYNGDEREVLREFAKEKLSLDKDVSYEKEVLDRVKFNKGEDKVIEGANFVTTSDKDYVDPNNNKEFILSKIKNVKDFFEKKQKDETNTNKSKLN